MPDPEVMLLSALVRTGQYQALAAHGVTKDLFHSHKDEAGWVDSYIQRTGKCPSKAAFKAKFPGFVVYQVDDIEHWCDEVIQESARRSLVNLLDQSVNLLAQDDIDAAVAQIHSGILDMQRKTAGASPSYDVFSSWEETFANVEARVDRVKVQGYSGVPSGFQTLDRITGGWQPGWEVIIGARLGVGKTWTTVKMATHAATLGFKVSYFSLEQTRHQIAMRTHSFASKKFGKLVFNSADLSRGHGFDLRAYKEFLAELQGRIQGRFLIHDASRGPVGPKTVAASLEKDQPDIVFVDFMGRMKPDGTAKDDWQAVGRLSGDLQDLAQRYDKPIIVGAQINRMGVGKEPPDAEHLALADKIGQDTDLLITMTPKSEHLMKMKIAKNRHGPAGVNWMAHFDPGAGIFDEVGEDKAQQIMERDNEVD